MSGPGASGSANGAGAGNENGAGNGNGAGIGNGIGAGAGAGNGNGISSPDPARSAPPNSAPQSATPVPVPLGGELGRAALRACFGRFATGVTVVTAGSTTPRGMTANAFSSVSLDPPLILVCVLKNATMHEVLLSEKTFAVSVLSGEQEKVARYFADGSRPRGEGEFDSVSWMPGPSTGAPIIGNCLAWIECDVAEAYEGGDHSIFLGAVRGLGNGPADDALLFLGGGFHRLPARPDADRR